MAKEIAFALINPYMIGKSRTGGIISRFISRTGLEFVAARMFGPGKELVEKYAEQVRSDEDTDEESRNILADYILRAYMPDSTTGRRKRVMMLVFAGEDAIEKVYKAAGRVRSMGGSAETVRDTFGDFILNDDGSVRYVEPAILVGPTPKAVEASLKLWAAYSETDGGIIEDTVDLSTDNENQKTLVILKPDNFRFPSSRPGNIIDLFSASGLRIIGAKIHHMSVAGAEEFYGPVRNILRDKLKGKVADMSAGALEEALGFSIPDDVKATLGDELGPLYGDHQFYQIIKFMTGCWVPECSAEDKKNAGTARCLALVYAGPNAVDKIRSILGPTDPSKAQPGSVRREYGQDIMVNAAHASDSPENAARELGIIKVEDDTINELIADYYS